MRIYVVLEILSIFWKICMYMHRFLNFFRLNCFSNQTFVHNFSHWIYQLCLYTYVINVDIPTNLYGSLPYTCIVRSFCWIDFVSSSFASWPYSIFISSASISLYIYHIQKYILITYSLINNNYIHSHTKAHANSYWYQVCTDFTNSY